MAKIVETAEALVKVLDEERTALVNGEIERLEPISLEKARLFEELESVSELPRAVLLDIQSRVQRNQGLLQASSKGLRAALTRLAAIRGAATALDTYSTDGKRQSISSLPPTHSRRA